MSDRRDLVPSKARNLAEKSLKLLPAVDHLGQIMAGNPRDAAGHDLIGFRPIRFGLWVMVAVLGSFLLWSIAAPIDSAAVSRGVVVLDTNKKTIQHLEGGIVDEIKVHEGKMVEAGEVLVSLDGNTAGARLGMVSGQFWAEKAALARMNAERDGKDTIPFPADLLAAAAKDPALNDTIESQKKLFETRRKSLSGNLDVLGQQVAQLRDEIRGLRSQENATSSQSALIAEELVGMRKLLASGNAPKSRVLALERQAADLQGRRGELLAQIARAEQRINEINIQMLNAKNDHMNEVVAELRETQVKADSLEEQKNAASDISKRLQIVAPVSGIVTNLKVHTKGGVIAPGDTLMDIVPQDDRLIIEAQVSPMDIDVVHKGLKARVRLSAYKSRGMRPLEGEVITVSPDRFMDEKTGHAYFIARIMVSPEELKKFENVQLYPGMPAEVLIVTGSRSLVGYLAAPIVDSMFKAFREE